MQELWALIMDAGTAYTAQTYNLTGQFLPKEWIMEKWEEGFYITAMAGSNSGWSLVAMSKGTPYTQQSYKVRGSLFCCGTRLAWCAVLSWVFVLKPLGRSMSEYLWERSGVSLHFLCKMFTRTMPVVHGGSGRCILGGFTTGTFLAWVFWKDFRDGAVVASE